MNNTETFSIHLNIGTHAFSIVVNRDNEELYREAEKMINLKLQQYSASFPEQKQEDYMAMVLLDIAVMLVSETNVDKRLQNMITQLDSVINK